MMLLLSLMSVPAFASVALNDKGIEDEAFQVSLIQISCSTTEKQAKDIYSVLKAVGMTPITNLDIASIPNLGTENRHVNGNDFYALMMLNNGAIARVNIGHESLYQDGKVKAKASDVSIPHSAAVQYKQVAYKEVEKIWRNMYSNSDYYVAKNFKANPIHWSVLKKVDPKWKYAPKDCVPFKGTFYFELYFNGKVMKGDGNLCWGYIDKNLNCHKFGIKNIGIK